MPITDRDKSRPCHHGKAWGLLALIALLLASCNEHIGLLPPSGGRMYEVLLVGDKDGIVKKILQEDVAGLPQSEPQFDVSGIADNRFNQSVSVARNIVKVDIDPQRYSTVRLRYEKDVWAEPQVVAYISAPSAKMLKDSVGNIAPTLLRLLNRAEINKSVSMLRQKRNVKAEKLVKRMFGIDMWIPMDMTSSKRGKDFLWLSNNSPTVMRNIVVYNSKFKIQNSKSLAGAFFCNMRDSALGANIKGETDSMHMKTIRETVSLRYHFKTEHDRAAWLQDHHSVQPMVFCNGLWEMTGDDMGGPFTSRLLPLNSVKGKRAGNASSVVVEGFVFAPGKKKRNAIKQLEAALYTIKY